LRFHPGDDSATVLTGMSLLTTSTNGLVPTTLIGAKSFCVSKLSLLIAGPTVIAGCTPQSSVIPVWRGAGHRVGCKGAVGAQPVFDNECLAEGFGQALRA